MSKSRGNLVFVSGLRDDGRRPDGRSAWRCWHTTTARTGSGPTATCSAPRPAWRAGARPPGCRRGPAARGLVADVRRHLADDLNAPAALAAVDAWVDHALSVVAEDREDEGAAPDLFRLTADALLGIAL